MVVIADGVAWVRSSYGCLIVFIQVSGTKEKVLEED